MNREEFEEKWKNAGVETHTIRFAGDHHIHADDYKLYRKAPLVELYMVIHRTGRLIMTLALDEVEDVYLSE